MIPDIVNINAALERKSVMKAALYGRVSSKAQAEEDKVSIAEQFAEMQTYCERHDYQISARYQDVGSGSTRKRPDFQRMLADARDGQFDVIVCWKSDRLSRGIYPASALMEVVEAQQIRLESVMDALDMKTFSIYAAVGKMEIDNFRERAALGKRGVAKRGKVPVGSISYGYRIGEDGRPEVDPIEGPIVQRIFEDYVYRQMSVPVIAQSLTEENAPLRKGSKYQTWPVSPIHRLLSREVYKGSGWYGRERHITTEYGRKHYSQPKESWIPLSYPPLISEETWAKAQALKREHFCLAKRNTKAIYLLQHLLTCEKCGMSFTARTVNRNTVRRNGRTYRYEYSKPSRYYTCSGMHRHGLKCREPSYLRADTIEELVWSEVAKVLKHPEVILQGLQAQATGQGNQDLLAEIDKSERQVREIQAEEDRAIRLHVSGKITEGQLDRQRKFITERLENARASLESLTAQRRIVQQQQSLTEGVMTWVKKIEIKLDLLQPEERQEVLRLVLHRVGIDDVGNVCITLAIPIPEFMSNVAQPTSCWWGR